MGSGFPDGDIQPVGWGYSSDCGNLDIRYDTCFVVNENFYLKGKCFNFLERTPVIAGSLDGYVFYKGIPVQKFWFNAHGTLMNKFFEFYAPKITDGTINLITGELKLLWDRNVDEYVDVKVNYEYNLEMPIS